MCVCSLCVFLCLWFVFVRFVSVVSFKYQSWLWTCGKRVILTVWKLLVIVIYYLSIKVNKHFPWDTEPLLCLSLNIFYCFLCLAWDVLIQLWVLIVNPWKLATSDERLIPRGLLTGRILQKSILFSCFECAQFKWHGAIHHSCTRTHCWWWGGLQWHRHLQTQAGWRTANKQIKVGGSPLHQLFSVCAENLSLPVDHLFLSSLFCQGWEKVMTKLRKLNATFAD